MLPSPKWSARGCSEQSKSSSVRASQFSFGNFNKKNSIRRTVMTAQPSAGNTESRPITCVARRHIDASAFKTYDAILAVALAGENDRKKKGEWKPGDPLLCYAKATRLANMNDRNESVERDAIAKLEREGWIVCTHQKQRRRKRAGTFTSNEWRVLTHDEYVTINPNTCPPPRY